MTSIKHMRVNLRQVGIGVLIGLLLGIVAPMINASGRWLLRVVFMPAPITIVDTRPDLSSGRGEYFEFNETDLDKVLGRNDWDAETLTILLNDNPEKLRITVWSKPIDNPNGPGTAHGRIANRSPDPDDWRVGQRIYVLRWENLWADSQF